MPEFAGERASSDDLKAVMALVYEVGLQTSGLAVTFPRGYSVVHAEHGVVAVISLAYLFR